jgi:hypothetical protein
MPMSPVTPETIKITEVIQAIDSKREQQRREIRKKKREEEAAEEGKKKKYKIACEICKIGEE